MAARENKILGILADGNTMLVKITLTEDCLGMMPTSQTIYRD